MPAFVIEPVALAETLSPPTRPVTVTPDLVSAAPSYTFEAEPVAMVSGAVVTFSVPDAVAMFVK